MDSLKQQILDKLHANGLVHTSNFPYPPTSVRLAIQRLRKEGQPIVSTGSGHYKFEIATESNTEAAV